MSRTYFLEPNEQTLKGKFSKDFTPCLQIASGDTVRARTLDAGWGLERRPAPGAPRKRFDTTEEIYRGHSMIGPIFIEGARPGMTLEVQIKEVMPGDHGWTSAGGFHSYWNQRLNLVEETEHHLDWELDRERMVARSMFGNFDQEIALKPFLGIMGMAPDEPGLHSTVPPRFCGGNLDCKELVPGSTLYLPIAVEGGYFFFGDGHAVQGDGEVAGPALECPMERVELTLTVREDLSGLKMPRAKTPAGWVTLGLHEDLDEAMWLALEGMLDLMQELYGMKRTEAYALASLVVDMRVTQVVNQTKGVHAVLPYGAVK
ncbi:MAG TPA: acetamidase/formamidase family protein [Bacilli bacterium]|nr:acetamidase/formamidase family protein [Bacilli bacterium]